ncbi:MAG TPA: hypothetical protein VK436_06000 [Methanocella sp.]|nr:hypothetical protein [Methanocella sp.]
MRRIQISPTRGISIVVLLCFASIFCATQAYAAPGDVIWQKTYGDNSENASLGTSAQQTTDGGYIITGDIYRNAIPSQSIAHLVKTKADGTMEWQQTYNVNGNTYGASGQQTTDGGYIITGTTNVSDDSRMYLVKTDHNGTPEWQQTYGGANTTFGASAQQTTDGGYIITGGTLSPSGSNQAYLVKTNPNGTPEWQQTYGDDSIGYSVQQTTDGGYIIVGTNTTPNFINQAYLVKTNPNGTPEWQQTYGDNSSGASVQQTTDGGYIITGSTTSSSDTNDQAYLVKTNPNGTPEWQQTYGDNSSGASVQQTTDGGYIMTGNSGYEIPGSANYQVYLVKTDPNGTPEWQQTYGPSTPGTPELASAGESVRQTADGNYLIGGYTNLTFSGMGIWNGQMYLLKVSSNGTIPSGTHLEVVPNTSSVSVGGGQSYDLILSTAPTGLAGYDLTISTNSSVADITSVSWPSWAQQLHNNTTLTPDAMRINGVDLNNQIKDGATNVTLATITVQGNTQGNTTIGLSNVSMDDDRGDQISPVIVNGSLMVNQFKPFPGETMLPTDPDHDGLYEDINGNGRLDFSDIVVFFQNLDWVRANEPVSAFDFNGNGRIDFDDVVTLYDMLLKTV